MKIVMVAVNKIKVPATSVMDNFFIFNGAALYIGWPPFFSLVKFAFDNFFVILLVFTKKSYSKDCSLYKPLQSWKHHFLLGEKTVEKEENTLLDFYEFIFEHKGPTITKYLEPFSAKADTRTGKGDFLAWAEGMWLFQWIWKAWNYLSKLPNQIKVVEKDWKHYK